MNDIKYYIYSMKLGTVNALGFGAGVVVMLPLYLNASYFQYFRKNLLLILSLSIIWMILHELIHSFSYLQSDNVTKDDITFGCELEKGVMYCLCKKLISKKDIFRSLLAPFIYIGLVTLIIGLVFDLKWLTVVSCINIVGAIMDVLMSVFFLRLPDIQYIETDNGTKFVLASKEDISHMKFIGIQFEKVTDDFEEIRPKDFKKVYVSKFSIVFFVALLVVMVIGLFVL